MLSGYQRAMLPESCAAPPALPPAALDVGRVAPHFFF